VATVAGEIRGEVDVADARGGGERTLLPGQSPAGEYILSVLVKRTFDIVSDGACTRAAEDEPLNAGEVFWDHPMNSSVRYESDFVPFKLGTDVVLNATAYAPGGAAVTACSVGLQVDQRRKVLRVVGDRQVRYNGGAAPVFTDPVPFTSMPLRFERAYGGMDVYSDARLPYPYPRNPLGRGFVVANTAAALAKLSLPNVEDPVAPIAPDTLCLGEYAQWETRPLPAGYGWFPKTWLPRASLAGVLPRDRAIEQELRRAYAALVPAEHREAYLTHGFRDMDFRFFNGASPGLAFPYLAGGETILTANLTPAGRLDFRLPSERPRIGIDIGEGVQEPEVVLQTVMIRMDDGQVDLVWRGAIPYRGPDWLPEMTKLDLQVA
jgi:hypothetical protein